MFATRVYHYRDPAAVILGLKELRKQGLTPRGLLFVALDPRGETDIVVPEDLDAVANVRVGDKLALVPPMAGPLLPLRRRASPARRQRAVERRSPARRYRLGARGRVRDQRVAQGRVGEERVPRLHAARAGLVVDGRSPVAGRSTCTRRAISTASSPTTGILARRIDDPGSTISTIARCASTESRPTAGMKCSRREMGNVLLVERRVLHTGSC